jgi:small subunit ribosomal protein S7
MLSQLPRAAARCSAARTLAHASRTLSTTPAVGQPSVDATLTDSLAALGLAPSSSASTTASPPPTRAKPVDESKLVLNIPPAEDPVLAYFASALLQNGHRARASRIVARTLMYLHGYTRAPPLPILREAVLAAAPAVKTTSRRVGAKTNFKPTALGEKQRTRYAVQWILKASESKQGQTVEERLAREIIAVLQGNSEALKKKEEVHKFAMVNR